MNKIERLRAALAGNPVDRPPFSIWYHFGNQHASPERTAQVHLEFFDCYDLDSLKVMNDYDYPMPAKMESIESPEDWISGPIDNTHAGYSGPADMDRFCKLTRSKAPYNIHANDKGRKDKEPQSRPHGIRFGCHTLRRHTHSG